MLFLGYTLISEKFDVKFVFLKHYIFKLLLINKLNKKRTEPVFVLVDTSFS